MTIHRLPLTYRAKFLHDIHKHLDAGKCGALIGVASSGKSRLVEFMGRPDVRERYLGEKWATVLFPWVDGNDLLEHSEWGLYEKILNAILLDLDRLPDGGGEARPKVEEWYWKLVRSENRHLARRLVSYAIADLKNVDRVVLLLDDFEKFFSQAEDTVFSGFRSLRDTFKRDNQYRLLYLLFSRTRPLKLRYPVSSEYQGFVELFKNFTQPIGCYSEEDALFMIQRLSEAFPLEGRPMTPELAQKLYEVTGGHAGLIDAAYHSKTESRWGQADIAKPIIDTNNVWNECNSMWEGLDEEDRKALDSLARSQEPEPEATRWLEQSGLVRRDSTGAPQIVELLRLYLAELTHYSPDIRLNSENRTLFVDGYVTELSEREFALAQALAKSRGHWRSYTELYRVLYPAQSAAETIDAVTEVRQLMQRVISKVRRACPRRSVIFHDSHHGYRML